MEWKDRMITIKGSELANALQKAFQAGAGFALKSLAAVQIPDAFGNERVSAMVAATEKSREAKEEIIAAAPKPRSPKRPAKRGKKVRK